MGILDPIVNFLRGIIESEEQRIIQNAEGPSEEAVDPEADVPPGWFDASNQRSGDLIDQLLSGVFDAFEDDVLEALRDDEAVTPEDVEQRLNDAEGAVLEDAVAAMTASLAVELAGATQLESHQFLASQIMTFLTLEDVLGRRVGMTYSKGIDPALEADVAKNTRSEFVDLADAVEFALRHKTNDDNWLHASGAPAEVVDAVGSVDPVNPENLVEEWGIRDDNLDILEEVGISVLEAEELLETPVEFGVIPDRDVVEQELDRSGLSEDTKALFLEVVDSIPTATTTYEERTRYEELVNQLDTAAEQGELDPDSVRPLFDDLDSRVVDELVARFRLVEAVPNKAPTRSQADNSFALGFTDLDTLIDRYDQVDVDSDKYPDIVREAVASDIDGDLQRAYAVGRLSEGEYGELMDYIDLPSEAQDTLFSGGKLSDWVERTLGEESGPEQQPVESISGIGDVRGSGLRAVGIETVADLAVADLELVADAAQVETETAREYIDAAILRTS